MRFPLEWVKDFVDLPSSPAETATRLTAAGFAVDAIEEEADGAVLDIDVMPNRPDGMNIYGLAREISAITGAPLRPCPRGVKESGGEPSAPAASVTIEAGDLCARYCARVVRNVRAAQTPEWMARRLRAVGVNGVSAVVDITNYVLWELGHPLHAFDLATLHGRRIVVRRARRGESLQTLDGVLRHLDTEALVIADADRAVALAGIMGGAATAISASTRDLLLESAWFLPSSVRRTAKALGMSTDASYRFERGADVEAAAVAIDRCAALIAEIAGGEVAPGMIDARAEHGGASRRTIHLRTARAGAMLGTPVEPARAKRALEALGFEARASEGGFEVTVPTWRGDVAGEADLIEEVGRILGYDEIPERLPHLPGAGAIHRFAWRREETLRSSLLASGYTEILSFSFVATPHDWAMREEGVAGVPLANPMAEGQDLLRSTLLPGLASALRHNVNHGVRDACLFEIGRVFRLVDGQRRHEDRKHAPAPHVEEILMAGLAATGLARPKHWLEPARPAGFFDVKGAVEEALSRLGIEASFEPFDGAGPLHPAARARIVVRGRAVGRIGLLAPEVCAAVDLKAPAVVAELDLTALLAEPGLHPTYRPLPRHPSSSRDLALVVREGTRWGEIQRTIRESGGDLVEAVSVFDRYEGKSLPPGAFSLAVSVVYRSPARTLSAEEIQSAEGRILLALKSRFGITLRSS